MCPTFSISFSYTFMVYQTHKIMLISWYFHMSPTKPLKQLPFPNCKSTSYPDTKWKSWRVVFDRRRNQSTPLAYGQWTTIRGLFDIHKGIYFVWDWRRRVSVMYVCSRDIYIIFLTRSDTVSPTPIWNQMPTTDISQYGSSWFLDFSLHEHAVVN